MFKKLETKWNDHTPVYLHARTKENFIFQLALTVILLGAMAAKDEWEYRKFRRELEKEQNAETEN